MESHYALKIISKNGKDLDINVPWTAVEFIHEDKVTFLDLFHMITEQDILPSGSVKKAIPTGSISVTICKGNSSKDESQGMPAQVNSHVEAITSKFGIYIRYKIEVEDSDRSNDNADGEDGPNCTSAFDVLMNAAEMATKKYPTERLETRGDYKLFNTIIKWLKDEEAYVACEKTLSELTVNLYNITTVIYNTLPHLPKIQRVGISLPQSILLRFLSDRNDISSQTFNKPDKHKHILKQLNQELLNEYVNKLHGALLIPCMQHQRFKKIKCAIYDYAKSLTQYIYYLDNKNSQVQEHQNREILSGSSFLASKNANYLRPVYIIRKYKKLELALEKIANYEHLCLNEFTPDNIQQKSVYLNSIELPFPFELLWCSMGNEKIWFIWKVPQNVVERDSGKSHEISKDIEKKYLKQFHSRSMRKKFLNHYGLLNLHSSVAATGTILNEIYADLTGDPSAAPSIKDNNLRLRLQLYLDSEDPDFAVDLRNINKGQTRQFDKFFDAVKMYINENTLSAAQERRQTEIGRLAVAISIRDLISQVSKTLDPSIPIPSESYLRLQFWPKNKNYHSAVHYTGKFDLCYKIQTRQLRSENIDSHYANMIYRLLREYIVKYRDYSALVSMDDKCHVKIGEPGTPLACAQRGRQVIAQGEGGAFSASDHDFAKFKIVPSANLITRIPENIGDSWYDGKLFVSLKDQVFQTSTPFRHCAELMMQLKLQGEEVLPILGIYSDGGPDHRLTYLRVQISLICLFVAMNLDMLIAARTAANQSFRNPVERCMATLNMGLQSVSLCRSKMDAEAEKLIKNQSSLKKLRSAADSHPALVEKMTESVAAPIKLLTSVFKRLQYASESVEVFEAASDAEVDNMSQMIHQIDPTVDLSKLQKKDLKNYQKLREFMAKHCSISFYVFSVKKCSDLDCEFCVNHPPRLPADTFSSLNHLPYPMPREDDKTHYKPFADVYGKKTSEEHRPSLQKKPAKTVKKSKQKKTVKRKRKATEENGNNIGDDNNISDEDVQNPANPDDADNIQVVVRTTAETVRLFVVCYMCGKPRCLYSGQKLTATQVTEFERIKEDILFSCGMDFPFEPVVTENGVNCNNDVSRHYYSTRVKFPPVCFVCGDALTSEEALLKEDLPICPECKLLPRFRTRKQAKKVKKS